jgi:hypothetical protein
MRSHIETDYLVVGAGAIGMGFVDALLDHSDARVVMLDRRHRPGGHWVDSYPFVQLHQPSITYGVNSTPLGDDRVDATGREAGFYERATGTEICAYFDQVMRERFLESDRVQFFPMSDYMGNGTFRSQLNGSEVDVTARRAIVDATYMTTRVPASDPPPFAVTDGVTCIPIGALTNLTHTPVGYVVVGGGKTAMDAVCWLLDHDVPSSDITWIRPTDSWLLNREFFQPGVGAVHTFEGVVVELESIAAGDSVAQVYAHLEEHRVMQRIDPSVAPGMLRGATASAGELELMRQVENVVRLGHVKRIDEDAITLEGGTIPTTPGHVHVHCAAQGLSDNPPTPIFEDAKLTLQPITRVSLSLSAGLIGLVEASGRSTAEKNRLCRANAWPQTPFDFLRHMLTGMRTEMEWLSADDVNAWVAASRLNLVRDIDRDPDQDTVAALQGRFLNALGPALAKFDELSAQATPAERRRLSASLS